MCLALATNYDYQFSVANARCFAENGRLSHIQNSFDNALAIKMIQSSATNAGFFYIGLQRVNESWWYADDEYGIDPVTYFNWAKGQPLKDGGDCVIMNRVDGKWYVADCGQYLPYFCDVPALHTPLYCTDKLNVDIVFMIDATGNQNDTRMIHDVLFGFNTVLPTQWYQDPLSCQSENRYDKEQTRVTGIVYYDSTWVSANSGPNFCVDRFPEIVDSMYTTGQQSDFVLDISVPMNIVEMFMSDCGCRRNAAKYGTRQIMIWIPMRDAYRTSRNISLGNELATWEHYLWPIRVSKKTATFPLWIDSLMQEIQMPSDHPEFIPTQVLTLWRFLCNLTGSTGETPPAPFI
ncbi:unnamed protein product, partial [Mesorhabditis belari]|uniref:C-type lectin domain-containing protein n=1 Tax=Mesorhabditis belari TaxID=2138241 RepID=A0AAF3FU12_9BILA